MPRRSKSKTSVPEPPPGANTSTSQAPSVSTVRPQAPPPGAPGVPVPSRSTPRQPLHATPPHFQPAPQPRPPPPLTSGEFQPPGPSSVAPPQGHFQAAPRPQFRGPPPQYQARPQEQAPPPRPTVPPQGAPPPQRTTGVQQPRAPAQPTGSQHAAAPQVRPVVSPSPSAASGSVPRAQQVVKAPDLELGFKYAEPLAKLPRRPGLGTHGIKTWVRTNHFLMKLSGNDIFHYDVKITPEIRNKGFNRAIIAKAREDGQFGRRLPAYDGKKTMYTALALSPESKSFQVVFANDDRNRQFKVTYKLVSTLNMTLLEMFLSGRGDVPQEVIQAFDIILRGTAIQIHTPVGRSLFSKSFGYQSLGGGVEAWSGYFQSVRPGQQGLCLNIDLSKSAFIEEISVDNYVAAMLGGGRFNKNRPMSEMDLRKVRGKLKGIKIVVQHNDLTRRSYRVHDVSSEHSRQIRFKIDDSGPLISVERYFMDRYNHPLQFPFLPCLKVGNPNRNTYVPMEVCKVAPRQRYPKKLDDYQVSRLRPEHPQERERQIVQRLQDSRFHEDPYAVEFGIKVDAKLTNVEARVLPSPELKYHGNGKCKPQFGKWDVRSKKLLLGAKVERWTCINFTRQSVDLARDFCWNLRLACQELGMMFSSESVVPVINARSDRVETSITQLVSTVSSTVKSPLELLIVLLDDRSGPYGDVKRVCETKLGIVTQCCLEKNAIQMRPQCLSNIALKINAKLGGRNTQLLHSIARFNPMLQAGGTIFFGADVTHPGRGENSPSIAAVVASMDWPEVTKYAGVIHAQGPRREVIEMLHNDQNTGMIRELLVQFYQLNGQRKPSRLIFYRDGVSEGQFEQVARLELDALFKTFASLEKGYRPTVTFVIVQKRHHTRLFPADARNALKNGNVLPGTVVDSEICHPHDFDFYLCSHASIQGTSRPAHYHVLHDENNFSADGLQQMTNDLCYTFARSTTAVSYVPPAYYAHLAAFRARYYLANDAQSIGSGGGPVQPLPPLCESLKRVMFYC